MTKRFISILISFMIMFTAFAQEGMWLLSQINQLDLAKKGLMIPVTDIYNPGKQGIANAVVQLGGGTASFVSPEGLLVTNHHVAYTALQRSSSVNSDYLTNGFLAKTHSEEIKAPGYQARMLLNMKDVTTDVLNAAKGISDPTEKEKKINEYISGIHEKIKKENDDVESYIAQMYNGKQYIQFLYKVFKDIRIVYSPPLAIGNYGGEIDNWMWPRHTGDFSFMRVYVSKDGKGKEFNADNVPYKPAKWLKVATEQIKDGDFTFIVGFPGATTRYRSSTSVHWNQEYNYPFSINNFKEIIALAEEVTKNDPEGKLKIASQVKGLANVMKNYEGKLSGMKRTHFLEKKLEFEKEFMKWVNSNPAAKQKYGDILAREKEQYEKLLVKTKDRDDVFGVFQGLAGTELSVASQIYYLVKEMAKPESERQPGLNEEALEEIIKNLEYPYADAFEPADKALMLRALKMANALPANQRITGIEYIFSDKSKSLEQFVNDAYKTTRLNNLEYARSLCKKTAAELEALNDPFMQMVVKMYPMSEEINKINEVFSANVVALRKEYLDALYEWKGKTLYPDANGTIRFTWGNVKGYRPADAVWYEPFTSLEGVLEKNTGIEPFDAPAGLMELYRKKDFGKWMDPKMKDVSLAFLNQCDITGGNSGSPVMNAKGQIIGVAFDGNYEAMISDWQYDYALQRCISVDMRYVLFITEKFGKAGFLLDEMGVVH